MHLVHGRWLCSKDYAQMLPTIKKLMKGEVLDGYIEAAKAKPLTEFMSSVRVVSAEHFKKKLPVDSERARMQRIFRRRFAESPEVTEEAVVVTLAEKRERWKDDRKIEWQDKYVKDHLHIDVQKFRDLIDSKKAAGLELTTKDAVYAYLLTWGYGRKSTIAAFLWAMSDDYPEFRVKHEEVREVVKVKPLLGPEREEEKIRRIRKSIDSVEELVDTVGQALSRLRTEGAIVG